MKQISLLPVGIIAIATSLIVGANGCSSTPPSSNYLLSTLETNLAVTATGSPPSVTVTFTGDPSTVAGQLLNAAGLNGLEAQTNALTKAAPAK